eukprot:TRINITY_DN6470_c0_g1_i9.p1 TRINITY_DN6470_c0_g1~~TRINITY_DN6470_c0_g1_i9.p1  ORF type:complete len:143 (-),score=29.10 TRINITY_DN6470_c0_g1_i9:505-933(-)
MVCAFQDISNLYMVLDYMSGGDLRYYMGQRKYLTEEETRSFVLALGFIIACTVLGLEYMHTKGVMHRDVKPENLVIDKHGYICLTDLGIARVLSPDNASDTSGTPGYMAPEVIFRYNHGVAVDYFALGVLAYECMKGIVKFL